MISFIITTQSSFIPLEILKKTLNSLRDFHGEIIIIDDSGKDSIPEGYYDDELFNRYKLIINEHCVNSFYSRYLAAKEAKNPYIRFVDVGDICMNMDIFLNNMNGITLSQDTVYHFNQSPGYYSCFGSCDITEKVKFAVLSGLECSTVWTKVFPKDLLIKSYEYILDAYPKLDLFHLDDYLLLSIIIKFAKRFIQLGNTPFIYYIPGTTKPRKVSKSFYNQMLRDTNFVRRFVNALYPSNSDIIAASIKIDNYVKKFTYEENS